MLFDPKWKETKADPFAIATLIAWLETMPADQEYCYSSNGHCMFAQYLSAHEFNDVRVGGWTFAHGAQPNREDVYFPEGWDDVVGDRPHTYGAALARARNLAP